MESFFSQSNQKKQNMEGIHLLKNIKKKGIAFSDYIHALSDVYDNLDDMPDSLQSYVTDSIKIYIEKVSEDPFPIPDIEQYPETAYAAVRFQGASSWKVIFATYQQITQELHNDHVDEEIIYPKSGEIKIKKKRVLTLKIKKKKK